MIKRKRCPICDQMHEVFDGLFGLEMQGCTEVPDGIVVMVSGNTDPQTTLLSKHASGLHRQVTAVAKGGAPCQGDDSSTTQN
jgi:hypothetical protein